MQEKYIGSQDVLLEVAGKAGLDVEAAKAFLSDLNAGRAEVEAELLRGHSLGVRWAISFGMEASSRGKGGSQQISASLTGKECGFGCLMGKDGQVRSFTFAGYMERGAL